MKSFEKKLNDYADLIIKVGLNLQKGQDLIINAPVSAVEFIRIITEKAYSQGVKEIYHRWSDDELSLIRYKYAPDSVFEEFPEWMSKGFTEVVKNGAAVLSLLVSNPELLKEIKPEKLKKDNITKAKAFKEYKKHSLRNNWCVASIPGKVWADMIFKDISPEDKENERKLWENIFEINRINYEDPIAEWQKHFQKLEKYKDILNKYKFTKLYYKSDGTDLTVELPKGHSWQGGNEKSVTGLLYAANLPTEEVFTMPYKYGINGTLASTMPLEYNGNLINSFKFTFENGKVTGFEAEEGYEILKNLLESDKNSSYLGEVAIVPVSSPIYKTGLIFYNTLYDENASCHFAFGSAYPGCIENGEEMSDEEKEKAGVNDSIIHVDFMVGSDKLNIDGETETGEMVAIFRNGEWAF